jgi:adenylate cyclase class IV
MSTTDNLEKEIKFIVTRDAAETVLAAVAAWPGAAVSAPIYELTSMYDTADGRMAAEDARLRVRQIGVGEAATMEFSYKRRLPAIGFVKQEEEIETAFTGISDVAKFAAILGRMGYAPTTSYERRRATVLVADVKLTVDEFPFGYLLEIEGEEDAVMAATGRLGLDPSASTLESCDDIYERLCRERGLVPSPHIRFDDDAMPQYGE